MKKRVFYLGKKKKHENSCLWFLMCRCNVVSGKPNDCVPSTHLGYYLIVAFLWIIGYADLPVYVTLCYFYTSILASSYILLFTDSSETLFLMNLIKQTPEGSSCWRQRHVCVHQSPTPHVMLGLGFCQYVNRDICSQ